MSDDVEEVSYRANPPNTSTNEMARYRIVTLCTLIFLFLLSLPNTGLAQSRDSLKTDFGIELLGRGLVYNFSFQHMISSSLGLHAGLEALGGSDDVVVAIPVGATAYLIQKDGSPYITGGVGILVGSGVLDEIDGTLYGFAGPGFEYRSNSGFVFRGTAYALIASGSFVIWPGLYVGYAF